MSCIITQGSCINKYYTLKVVHYKIETFETAYKIANPPIWKICDDQPSVPWEHISWSFKRKFIIKKIKDVKGPEVDENAFW